VTRLEMENSSSKPSTAPLVNGAALLPPSGLPWPKREGGGRKGTLVGVRQLERGESARSVPEPTELFGAVELLRLGCPMLTGIRRAPFEEGDVAPPETLGRGLAEVTEAGGC